MSDLPSKFREAHPTLSDTALSVAWSVRAAPLVMSIGPDLKEHRAPSDGFSAEFVCWGEVPECFVVKRGRGGRRKRSRR